MKNKRKPIIQCNDEIRTGKGVSHSINPEGFENAIIVAVDRATTTKEGVKTKIEQAFNEKRPTIIENVDELIYCKNRRKKI